MIYVCISRESIVCWNDLWFGLKRRTQEKEGILCQSATGSILLSNSKKKQKFNDEKKITLKKN